VRAVLLDFYCTLADLSDAVRSRGFDNFARRLGLPLGPGELYRRYARMISGEPAEDAASGFVPYRTLWLSAGRRLLAPFGRESAAEQFADAYADMHATAVIFPEVQDAVQALARRVRIGVVANADHDYLMRCLARNGLRLDPVVDSETARCYKPEPRIFQRACDALAVPAGEAVMVGDTPETDIQGAHRAGLRAVWVNRDHRDWPDHLVQPDAVIEELGQLLHSLRLPEWLGLPGRRASEPSTRPGTQTEPPRSAAWPWLTSDGKGQLSR
jgi:2-haloalkanoic acid dehalogenase type II